MLAIALKWHSTVFPCIGFNFEGDGGMQGMQLLHSCLTCEWQLLCDFNDLLPWNAVVQIFSQREHASLWDYLCNKHTLDPKENISSLVGHLTPLEPGCVASLEFQGVTLHTARVTAQVWLLLLLSAEDKISPTQLPGVHPISSSSHCVFIRVPSWTDLKSHWSQWESNVLIA